MLYTPVVPHKAVAEVSIIGNLYRKSWLLCSLADRANPLMDQKVVGVVLFVVAAAVISPTASGFSVVF